MTDRKLRLLRLIRELRDKNDYDDTNKGAKERIERRRKSLCMIARQKVTMMIARADQNSQTRTPASIHRHINPNMLSTQMKRMNNRCIQTHDMYIIVGPSGQK